jgi:type III restriction enzyme
VHISTGLRCATRAGSNTDPRPGPTPDRVRALEERIVCEITFPRVIGYRYELAGDRLSAEFTADSTLAISTQDLPTRTGMASIIGEARIHDLYGLQERREAEIDFRAASWVKA